MDGFTLLDGGVIIVILVSAVLAHSRGLVRELLSIAGWAFAGIVAYMLTPAVEPLLREVPILSELISGSCMLSLIVAFAVSSTSSLHSFPQPGGSLSPMMLMRFLMRDQLHPPLLASRMMHFTAISGRLLGFSILAMSFCSSR